MDDAELLSFVFKYGLKLHYEGSRRLIETKTKIKISYEKSLSSLKSFTLLDGGYDK
jgi:hypothetical protein